MSGTYNGNIYIHEGTYSTVKYGLIYVYIYLLKCGGPLANGGHPGGRRAADGRAGGHPGGRRTGGRYTTGGHTHMLTLWGKGGCGGSPNAEAGKMYQHPRRGSLRIVHYTSVTSVMHPPSPTTQARSVLPLVS
jgi:hypothetical protein